MSRGPPTLKVFENNSPTALTPESEDVNLQGGTLVEPNTSKFTLTMGLNELVVCDDVEVNILHKQSVNAGMSGVMGAETRSLAYLTLVKQYVDGARVQSELCFPLLAEAWYVYGRQNFYLPDSLNALNPYGTSVSESFRIGFVCDPDGFRELPQRFPLHTVPCDICSFLLTVARNKNFTSAPFLLDLAGVHRFFSSKLNFMPCPTNSHSNTKVTYHCDGSKASGDWRYQPGISRVRSHYKSRVRDIVPSRKVSVNLMERFESMNVDHKFGTNE